MRLSRQHSQFLIQRPGDATGFTDHDLVLITYGTLRRDIEKLRQIRFHYAILDEAQEIKNQSSQVSKAARLLDADQAAGAASRENDSRPAEERNPLTGVPERPRRSISPAQNHVDRRPSTRS